MGCKILDRNNQDRGDRPLRSNIDPPDQYRKGTVETWGQHVRSLYNSFSYYVPIASYRDLTQRLACRRKDDYVYQKYMRHFKLQMI